MRTAANSCVKMAKVSITEGVPIQVYGDRNLFVQKRSPNKPAYIDVAQERSQVF